MTPMTLERAVEIGYLTIEDSVKRLEPSKELEQAAATLRAWLPFIKAAEAYCIGAAELGQPTIEDATRHREMRAAYRAAKEGK